MTKNRVILCLLFVGVAVSFYYAWQTMPRVQYAGDESLLSSEAAKGSQTVVADNNRFDFSGGGQREFKNPTRNLFGPLFPPPPKVKVKVKVVQPVAPVAVVQAPPPPVVVPPPAPVVRATMPPFKVLGFLDKGQELTAFVSLQGEIHLLKQGETFAGEFKVVELNAQTITLGRISGAGEVSLPLTENSVSPRVSAPQGSPARMSVPARISWPVSRIMTPTARPESRPTLPAEHPPMNDAN